MIRATEFQIRVESNSPALHQLCDIAIKAFHHSGHIFTPETDGLVKQLPDLLRKSGLQDVQTHAYTLECRAGTKEGQLFIDDWTILYRIAEPFLQKWTQIPNTYQDIYQQMLKEIHQPDFVAVSHLLSVWGVRFSRFTSLAPRP